MLRISITREDTYPELRAFHLVIRGGSADKAAPTFGFSKALKAATISACHLPKQKISCLPFEADKAHGRPVPY